jgi:hypothetical protein
VAGDEPVEAHADRGEVLLDRWHGFVRAQLLDVRRHDDRLILTLLDVETLRAHSRPGVTHPPTFNAAADVVTVWRRRLKLSPVNVCGAVLGADLASTFQSGTLTATVILPSVGIS